MVPGTFHEHFKMDVNLFVLVCCFLGVQQYAYGQLDLQVTPPAVTPAVSDFLIVSCTFTYTGSNFDTLVSLTISKSTEQSNPHNFVDVITIDSFNPNQVTEKNQTGAQVSGHMDSAGDSNLTMVWTFPTSVVAGFYRCLADGLDDTGQPIAVNSTKEVTSQDPDLTQLNQEITDLDSTFINHEARIDILVEDWYDYLNTSFDISGDYNNTHYLASRFSWPDVTFANTYCDIVGGHLAEINDEAELDFIRPFLQTTGSWSMLVGAVRDDQGMWKYINANTNITFFNWNTQEPQEPDMQCMVLDKAFNWTMTDYPCHMPSPGTQFLCEVSNI